MFNISDDYFVDQLLEFVFIGLVVFGLLDMC